MVRGSEGKNYVQKDEDLRTDRMIILKWIFNTYNRKAWSGARNFGFHNMQAFSSVAEELLASQEESWSMALVGFCMPQNAVTG
jgi:hypothetical protein